MHSSSHRSYARFIPREEVVDCVQWKFNAVDGSDFLAFDASEKLPEPEAEVHAEEENIIELPAVIAEEEHLHLLAQARDEAFAQGEAQGQSQTAAEWQQRMQDYQAGQGEEAAQRLNTVMQTLQASLTGMQQDMAQQVLLLASDIARQVVRQELSVNPQALLPVVREAVTLLVTEGRPATVRLNPDDLESTSQALRTEFEGAKVQWQADAAVQAGSCLVESAGTVVDGSIDSRWNRAVAALGLQSPWQEP